ncbi:hypothetical protein P9173_09600 [Bacillus safensis]|uniref:hypothetical protein n=1 Tax=Bacillus safensis TaxID=561879 RepID=UPI0022821B52|nr:hypothetical protein [Bacillus safensis]MCY7542444.1 hypothetical protein [Bacillus safensis]MCY7552563.1 hypothetical protein [Bacillus safensis]MCY7644750.1 hypothetical protein [Bacillus safensis]MCY7655935.1 hypothetical protein [Bacillus safensis]MEC3710410.1 hypothetical protein [Bacillus safensis]
MTGTKYRTEKRIAVPGEQILITNAENPQDYKNGDVLTVVESKDLYVYEGALRVIAHREYEVIVGKHTPAPNLDEMDYDELVALSEAVMTALRTRSYKLGYDQGRFDVEIEAVHGTYEKSDQQKRDEIVAQAKEDVRVLYYKDYIVDTDFIVNAEKRTVVALRKSKMYGHIKSKGIAKCVPSDCFNVHIGKAIALRRALGLEVPSEYLNVPQPTDVRVGDIIEAADCCGEKYRFKVGLIEDDKIYDVRGDGTYTYLDAAVRYLRSNATNPKAIDDSRVGDGE